MKTLVDYSVFIKYCIVAFGIASAAYVVFPAPNLFIKVVVFAYFSILSLIATRLLLTKHQVEYQRFYVTLVFISCIFISFYHFVFDITANIALVSFNYIISFLTLVFMLITEFKNSELLSKTIK